MTEEPETLRDAVETALLALRLRNGERLAPLLSPDVTGFWLAHTGRRDATLLTISDRTAHIQFGEGATALHANTTWTFDDGWVCTDVAVTDRPKALAAPDAPPVSDPELEKAIRAVCDAMARGDAALGEELCNSRAYAHNRTLRRLFLDINAMVAPIEVPRGDHRRAFVPVATAAESTGLTLLLFESSPGWGLVGATRSSQAAAAWQAGALELSRPLSGRERHAELFAWAEDPTPPTSAPGPTGQAAWRSFLRPPAADLVRHVERATWIEELDQGLVTVAWRYLDETVHRAHVAAHRGPDGFELSGTVSAPDLESVFALNGFPMDGTPR